MHCRLRATVFGMNGICVYTATVAGKYELYKQKNDGSQFKARSFNSLNLRFMYINCTDKELEIFNKIAFAAKELGVPCYLIGGFVRDKILGRETKDIDIVCVGDGIELAHKVAQQFNPRPGVNFFKNFGTAQLKTGGLEIEFVGARKESYSPDSRKPEVATGTLEDDQHRRDFTINALAISLNEADHGAAGRLAIARRRVLERQRAAVLLDDLLHDGETEPGALGPLRGHVGLE